MGWIKEMFEDESGGTSCMRVMCFLALFAAIGLAIAGKDTSVGAFLMFAGGGKVVSKFAETRGKSEQTEERVP